MAAYDYARYNVEARLQNEEISKQDKRVIGVFLAISISTLIATAVVLITTDESCDRPLASWSILSAASLALVPVQLWLLGSFATSGAQLCLGCAASALTWANTLFGFAWTIVGSVWVGGGGDCAERAPFQKGLATYLLTLGWLQVFLLLLSVCCARDWLSRQLSATLAPCALAAYSSMV